MTHHTDADLLPCPFCGGEAEAKKTDMSYDFTLIKCQECDAQSDECIDLEDAAEAWNRRAPSVLVPQGWRLVPAEPTDEMLNATYAGQHCSDVFRDMLAAAPQPPEAEENPLQEPLDEALQSLEFYKRRCDLLQSIQPRMRDPERTMVCDVLANGHLLQGGDGQPDKARYAPPEAAPVRKPLTDAEIESATGAKQGTPLFLAAKGFTIAIERAHGIKD